MKQIKLTQGYFALVDDEDYELLNSRKWHVATRKCNSMYAISTDGVLMHRAILNLTDPSIKIDHKNQNGLDNRRCNLRIATIAQNACNIKAHTGSTSKYLGVSIRKYKTKSGIVTLWQATIRVNKNKIYIGSFNNEQVAAQAYNKFAALHHGEFANLNLI